jgi:hypothetical protein
MEDKIFKLIDEHKETEAKDAILEYEEKIKEEKNEYTRCRMIDRLNSYKRMYSDHIEHVNGNIKKKEIHDIDLSIGTPSSLKLEISDENANYVFESSFRMPLFKNDFPMKKMSGLVFSEVLIVDSKELTVSYFESEQSVYINRVFNSTIICKGKQIRLLDSHNLCLYVDVSCGITLERSSNIKICALKSSENNNMKINDFSNPFKSTNYKIITDDNIGILNNLSLSR